MNHVTKTTRISFLFIAMQYITALLIIIFFTAELSPGAGFAKDLLFYICIFFVPVCLFIKMVYKANPISYLGLQLNLRAIITGIIIGIVMAAIFFISNGFKTNGAALDTLRILALTGGVLAGIFEEIAFRGFYLNFLKSRFGFVWANIVTAILFSLLHIRQIMQQGIIQLVMLFILALFLGYAREKTKSLWVPIIVHITFNILIFLFR